MGSTFTKEKASEILGVSTRTIYDYLKKGWLREVKEDDELGIPQQDVFELKMCFDEDIKFMPVNPLSIAKLYMKTRLLEAKLEMIMRVLNLRHDPLNLTDEELVNYYKSAEQMSSEGWPPHSEETWINFLLRLREKDLEQLAKVVEDSNPWRPFHKLIVMMESTPFNKELKDELKLALDNIRMLSAIWLEAKGDGPKTMDKIIAKDNASTKKTKKAIEKAQSEGKLPE